MPDAPITSPVRPVSKTWDGRGIGFKEKLDRDDPTVKRAFNLAALAKGRAALSAKNKTLAGKIKQAQKASATKRGKR